MMRARHEREREFRRQSIIEATEQLLNEKTFESITMDDIAIKSDFAKASIYQYFENKEEILCEVMSKLLEMNCYLIEEKCLSKTDPVQAMRKTIELECSIIRQYPWVARIRANKPVINSHWRDRLLAQHNRKKELITGIIQRGQADGTFIVSDHNVLANVILAMAAGFGDPFLALNITNDVPNSAIEMLTSIIIKGITKGE